MQKFRDVLSRWESGGLSMMEAGELLGMSERQFRGYRARYEEAGLEGLVDRRLGKRSARRVPEGKLQRLGIEHIPAYSPEARGRSERMFATLQSARRRN